ncbi:MAG: hypothetical protein LBI62_05215 [Candidatus Accumulibacter sp.]|nr:hypothetical protein [Accumulibacter sp.]
MRRKVTITATLASDPSVEPATAVVTIGDAFGTGNAGWLALYDNGAASMMNWEEAGEFCSRQGGHLPLINNTASQSYDQVRGQNVSIERIGSVSVTVDGDTTTPWANIGLPVNPSAPSANYYYWTGTEHTDTLGNSWLFGNEDELVVVRYAEKYYDRGVICAP